MAVDVLDVAPADAVDAVRADLAETEQDELPDAVFVHDLADDVDTLSGVGQPGRRP
ncbi:MAG: hypothetical protein V9F00_02500 [Nocardioides sp.]